MVLQQIYKDYIHNINSKSIDLQSIIIKQDKAEAVSKIVKYLLHEVGFQKNKKLNFSSDQNELYFFELGGNSIQATQLALKLNFLINKNVDKNHEKDFTKE